MLFFLEYLEEAVALVLQRLETLSFGILRRLDQQESARLQQAQAMRHRLDGIRQVLEDVHERNDVQRSGLDVLILDRTVAASAPGRDPSQLP